MADNNKNKKTINNRYELKKSLGRGGFGQIYLAYDKKMNRQVALKQLFGSLDDEEFANQIDRETRIHAKLSSQNIISLYDSFTFEDSYYLVMELMDRSLAEITEPVSEDTAAKWIYDCLKGLNDIHNAGVIHRDLKPSNIFFDKNGQLRIGDFGAAMSGESATIKALSPKFMAPEIIQGKSDEMGPPSDLYSLGIVAYELLLGQEQFKEAFKEIYEGADSQQTINFRWQTWHLNQDRKPPRLCDIDSNISEGFSNWILELMERDINNRFSAATEAMDAMGKIDDLDFDPKAKTPHQGVSQPVTIPIIV